MKPGIHTYKDCKITVRGTEDAPRVTVYDDPKKPAAFNTTSLDLAMKWIDKRTKVRSCAAR